MNELKPGDVCTYSFGGENRGEFRFCNAECDAFHTATIVPVKYGISCLICGETIRTTNIPINYPEVCDKCKAAVLKIRED